MQPSIPAKLEQSTPGTWMLTGHWTAAGLGVVPHTLATLACQRGRVIVDGAGLAAIDSAGVWVLSRWLADHGAQADLRGWQPRFKALMELVGRRESVAPVETRRPSIVASVGRLAADTVREGLGLMTFVGQVAVTGAALALRPRHIRWRTVLHNVQVSGYEALPIVGLTSFLLGVVVAYQGADQLRHYGANIFVVDLVGYAMLREFAPLISAIIIAGRSGSAYAAQIGTMVVTEEVDAMRTIDIDPLELLVLPKILALAIALPLLTVFADITGVLGGMMMAKSQLDIGFPAFIDRFGSEMQGSTLMVGLGKSFIFSFVIASIGCFQGFRTRDSADSVGRQTTLAVVQSIFLVIVADAFFSVAFSVAGL